MTSRILALELLLLAPAVSLAQRPITKARICIAPAQVESTVGTTTDVVSAIRETFTSYLTGPSIGVVALTARLEFQAREEAKGENCPYLLVTTLKQIRKPGGSGLVGRMAGTAVQQGAWSAGNAIGSTAGRIAGGAVAGAAGAAANNYAHSMTSNDELTLTYRLQSASGTVLVEKRYRRKAESNGQDLLTPLIEKASEAIAAAAAQRTP
jgi:outer membrane lipoprotein SlyB